MLEKQGMAPVVDFNCDQGDQHTPLQGAERPARHAAQVDQLLHALGMHLVKCEHRVLLVKTALQLQGRLQFKTAGCLF